MTRAFCIALLVVTTGACRSGQQQGSPEAERAAAPQPAAQPPAVRPAAPEAGELLVAGAPAPDLELPTHTGTTLRLSELRGKPVVVYFYPKDNTPGCTVQAQELRDAWQSVQQSGVTVIGVSADSLESHKTFAADHDLPFPLVPDPDHKIARAFGVPIVNGKTKRVTFVIDSRGTVAKVFPAVTPKGSASEVLTAVQALST